MYCRKMAAHIGTDKLLIHYFQDSLTGPASRWYIQLDHAHIHVWKDLIDTFLKQYKHNIDMAPGRLDLQRMEKKSLESFKEYAQRWRDMTVEVQPPLTDKEMKSIFINALQALFYEYLKKSDEKPNVNENPLPTLENPKVNFVDGLVEKCKMKFMR
ncbi:Gag-pro-like protein [Cucumis melo var. makuwa]|uniref:Gag-pro-like protein n=1 Tax=Cucumis melo var. makuwa TaxID=1194695 RepID=A0A5A7UBW4_CUCMM|nr:Gag-pro-like protein [Cucumis melo var. makuwa]